MTELRHNPLSGRWVTIAGERAHRPSDFVPRRLPVEAEPNRPCPFCPGSEEATPPALETYGPQGRWLVRVVPNLYPAFAGSGPLQVACHGPLHRSAPATGIHEVLIFSPHHRLSWADLSDAQAGLVMAAIRDRIEDHRSTAGVEYTQVIVNHGREAGASLEHPHGQLLGIPFVPGELDEELRAFRAFAKENDGAPLLDTVVADELAAGQRIVVEDERAVAIAPYWSGTPYELLVVPRRARARLDEAAPGDLAAVARVLRASLGRLRALLGDVAYNLVFHTAPHRQVGPDDERLFSWHVHVLPRTTTAAGFEQGTGVRINVVPPERAALELGEVGD
ncbi:MAG: galactose-1-phosphate uridylyltransferase [Actinobacteria bacterium]|nr:galactose-1-phosphate uridylyltransferase [Actinomycetota bacterium]